MGPYAFSRNEIPVFLAPMSGVTDAPFRKQVMKFGAETTITEMVAGEDLKIGNRESLNRITIGHYPGIHAVQLVGREAGALKFGAICAREAGADVIDINMGCPSRRVTGGLSGSALMRDLDHAVTLIEAVMAGAEDVPVTLKMRLGWDWDCLNAPQLAKRAENAGVQLVTVHGRTRQDFYEGRANWSAIQDVVTAVNIPVIANGDIFDVRSANEALHQSGADGVMVGRAAVGRPWAIAALQAQLNGRAFCEPNALAMIDSLVEQAEDCVELYSARVGMRVIRKHVSEFLDYICNRYSLSLSKEQRQQAITADTPQRLKDFLIDVFEPKAELVA